MGLVVTKFVGKRLQHKEVHESSFDLLISREEISRFFSKIVTEEPQSAIPICLKVDHL